MLQSNTGSWLPEAESYFYGTEAQVRGIGRILIYKIRVWQISTSAVMTHSPCVIGKDSAPITENSQLTKIRISVCFMFVFLLVLGLLGSWGAQFCPL